ncbi:MAG: hypothetical protein KDB27_05980 [Planctomycetales bacterium]|nr:hypothetical protein [Planctomycetales bacterium]
MGVVSFLIPDLDRLGSHSVDTCHFVGFDGVPWTATSRLEGNYLKVQTTDEDSAKFVIPWKVDHIGYIALSTGTLKRRTAAFHLPLELARGTLCRLRNYIAAYRQFGFSPNVTLRKQLATATESFIQAATSQCDANASSDAAQQAINAASAGIMTFVETFTQFRWATPEPLPKVWIGHELREGFSDDPRATVAAIPVLWKGIEPNTDDFQWSSTDELFRRSFERRLRAFCGPMLDLRPGGLPDWIYLWQDDIGALESFVCRYVAEIVRRYCDRVHIWNCAAALGTGADLNLSEEDRLRLTVRAIETIRAHDPKSPVLVCIDEPWGEHLVKEELELSPFQLADMLARADIGVSGFDLRFNIGASCNTTLARDALDFGGLVDRWSTLAKPLVLTFDAANSDECQSTVTPALIAYLRTKRAVHGIVFGKNLPT